MVEDAVRIVRTHLTTLEDKWREYRDGTGATFPEERMYVESSSVVLRFWRL